MCHHAWHGVAFKNHKSFFFLREGQASHELMAEDDLELLSQGFIVWYASILIN